MKLLVKFGLDKKPYIFKVMGFKVHQKYLESGYDNSENSIAIGFWRLWDATPKIDDIEDFKKSYLNNMPSISESVILEPGLDIQVPYII